MYQRTPVTPEEHLVAERDVHPVQVRISTSPAEGFWRVSVAALDASRQVSTTTVADEDSFLWPLIQGAVAGDDPAWGHLAHWGHCALNGRSARLHAAG